MQLATILPPKLYKVHGTWHRKVGDRYIPLTLKEELAYSIIHCRGKGTL